MKVLFIEIDTENSWAVASLGPAFLASYLRQYGHQADFVRMPHDEKINTLIEMVHCHEPDLIGVSLTTRQWLRAQYVICELKKYVNIPVIAGGLHPTFSPESVIQHEAFDYVCLGEGEAALLELVTNLNCRTTLLDGNIDNIWARGGNRPKLRNPIEPIDSIPYMARDFLDEKWGVHHISTQRGCPFPCTYCAARMYNELYANSDSINYGRRRSCYNVIDELKSLRENGSLKYVIFLDDTFTIHHHWVKEFCKIYRREISVPFSIHARIETINQQVLSDLAAAGCRHITYGVESGSERVRREIMKRSATNKQFRDVFRWTKDAGIMTTANYIIGTPGETIQEMEETLDLHREIQPEDFGYFVFYPYPGTPLFHLCQEKKWLPDNYLEIDVNHRISILNLPNIDKQQIARIYDEWTTIRADHACSRFESLNIDDIRKSIFDAASRA